jgi:hypothetical protein
MINVPAVGVASSNWSNAQRRRCDRAVESTAAGFFSDAANDPGGWYNPILAIIVPTATNKQRTKK